MTAQAQVDNDEEAVTDPSYPALFCQIRGGLRAFVDVTAA